MIICHGKAHYKRREIGMTFDDHSCLAEAQVNRCLPGVPDNNQRYSWQTWLQQDDYMALW